MRLLIQGNWNWIVNPINLKFVSNMTWESSKAYTKLKSLISMSKVSIVLFNSPTCDSVKSELASKMGVMLSIDCG